MGRRILLNKSVLYKISVFLLSFLVIIVFIESNAYAASGKETDEDGGVWDYDAGTYTSPEGEVYPIENTDSGSSSGNKSSGNKDSGTCGNNVTWTLDDNGLLTISGTGHITSIPWEEKEVKALVIESGVKSICDKAFLGKEISSAVIPDTVESIGVQAFMSCKKLTSIVIPKSIKTFEYGAFAGCSALKDVTLEPGLTMIGGQAFRWCESIEEIVIPDSVTNIDYSAFQECTSLKSITIPDGVKEIDWQTFAGCSNLTRVMLNVGLETIASEAFSGCSSLISISIPQSVSSIGGAAFCNCYSLESVDIKGHTEIADDTFKNCYELNDIHTPACNKEAIQWFTDNGYGDALTVMPHLGMELLPIIAPTEEETGMTEGQICSACNEIFTEQKVIPALKDMKVLRLPASLKVVEKEAFANLGCEAIIIPDGCNSIRDYAFMGCSKLRYIKIPASVKNYPENAFDGCSTDLVVDWNYN